MEDKRKQFRFNFDTNNDFDSCMNITNQARKDNGLKPISENEMISIMVKYYYQNKFNPEEINRRIAQEAKYQASIIRKSFGNYLNAMLTSMNDIAGMMLKQNVIMKTMAVQLDAVGKLREGSSMTQLVSDMISDEELLKKIEREYRIRMKKEDKKNSYIDFFAEEETKEDDKQEAKPKEKNKNIKYEDLIEIDFGEDETPEEYKMKI